MTKKPKSPHQIKFIHYGAKRFDLKRFRPINGTQIREEYQARYSYFMNKRRGGLWASPINSFISWKDFCFSNRWNRSNFNKSFKFRLKHSARVLTINSRQDFLNTLAKYPYATNLDISYEMFSYMDKKQYLDFDLISKDYDAVFLTALGHFTNHLCSDGQSDLNSWDCESIQIINPACIKPIN